MWPIGRGAKGLLRRFFRTCKHLLCVFLVTFWYSRRPWGAFGLRGGVGVLWLCELTLVWDIRPSAVRLENEDDAPLWRRAEDEQAIAPLGLCCKKTPPFSL